MTRDDVYILHQRIGLKTICVYVVYSDPDERTNEWLNELNEEQPWKNFIKLSGCLCTHRSFIEIYGTLRGQTMRADIRTN